MKTFKYYLIILLLTQIFQGCKTTQTAPPEPPVQLKLSLSVDEVSCTEAWLKISSDVKGEIIIKRDEQEVMRINIISSDTIVVNDSLQPNKVYSYQVFSITENLSSCKIPVQTLDTTSHNFTWQTFEVGDFSSNSFYDVAILRNGSIWAVGELYMYDSLGQQDEQNSNAVSWDGSNLTVRKIQFYTICGQTNETPYEAKSLVESDDGNLWIAMFGSQLVKLEKNTYQPQKICSPTSFLINELWINKESIYIAGRGGNGFIYTNGDWKQLITNTSTSLSDIWGNYDNNNNLKILCTVQDMEGKELNQLLEIREDKVFPFTWPNNVEVQSVWFKSFNKIYACGDGLWVKRSDGNWIRQQGLPPYFKTNIRGTGLNNIFMMGSFGLAAHFNGVTWKQIPELSSASVLSACAIRGNTIAIVGFKGRKAFLAIGKQG